MSTIHSKVALLGFRSSLIRGSASSSTVRSIAYSRQGSAITARPSQSRRLASAGVAPAGVTSSRSMGVGVRRPAIVTGD